MTLLKQFLRAILPEEGVKCWTSIHNKIATNHFCATTDELAEQILANDALGRDTYHACAAFKTDQNRRAANAGWMKAFWADIDVGKGKAYATIPDAIQACDKFCDGLDIPLPGFVASGYGLHAYWVFDRVLPSGEWLPVAQRFKLLMQARGFNPDPASLSQTADAARILRSPGTHNYKLSPEDVAAGRSAPATPRSVTILDPDDFEEFFSPVSWDNFSRIIINTQCETPAPIIKNSLNTSVNAKFSAGISKAFDPTVGVKQGCRGSMRVRYAGELVARGYVYEDVVAKVAAWDKLCDPPEGDAAVLHSVKSAFSMHATKHPELAPRPVINGVAVALSPVQEVLPPRPRGFSWGNANQLMISTPTKDANGKVLKDEKGAIIYQSDAVCLLPVYMQAWLNEEGHERKHAYLFRAYHPIDGWYSFHMNAETFNSERCYAYLVKNGVSIVANMDKAFKLYVREAENMLRLPGTAVTQYGQFGWKDTPAGPNTAFLAGSKLCHADGRVEDAVGTDKLTSLMHAMQPARGGSRAKWSMAANKLGMPGLEPHLFMVVCSFASILMKYCVDEGNGGSILSIVSEDSGKGKTPMATGMASVWGTLPSIVSTGNFTGNRLIDDVVRRCNIIQVQEEMPYSDPVIAAEGVKKFTSGSDRGRLDQGGNSKGMPERYQTLLVSISNKSLYGLVKMADGPMACRIFEVDINDTADELIANVGGIAREMMANCGYAGLDFARICVEPQLQQYLLENLRGDNMGRAGRTVISYREALASRPEHRFIVSPLACADVAARILNHYGIMQFDTERLMQWAIAQAKIYTAVTDTDLAAVKLDMFIREHVNTCVTVMGPYNPREGTCWVGREPSGPKLYMRKELKTNRLYIAADPLKTWCTTNGISFIGLGKKLKADGVLVNTSRPVTLGAGTNINSVRCLCWELDTAHAQINSDVQESLTLAVDNKVMPINR